MPVLNALDCRPSLSVPDSRAPLLVRDKSGLSLQEQFENDQWVSRDLMCCVCRRDDMPRRFVPYRGFVEVVE